MASMITSRPSISVKATSNEPVRRSRFRQRRRVPKATASSTSRGLDGRRPAAGPHLQVRFIPCLVHRIARSVDPAHGPPNGLAGSVVTALTSASASNPDAAAIAWELLTRPPQAIDLKTAVVGLHWRINARFVENHRRPPSRRAIRERDTVANTVKTRSNSVLDTVTTVTRRKDHRAQRRSPCGRSLLAWNPLPERPFAMSGSRWPHPESWPEPA